VESTLQLELQSPTLPKNNLLNSILLVHQFCILCTCNWVYGTSYWGLAFL